MGRIHLILVTAMATLLARTAAAQPNYGRGSSMRRSVPRIRQTTATVGPAISKEVIRRVVRSHRSDIQACYEALLVREPDAEGRVVVDFRIQPDGRVGRARTSETDLDRSVGDCIAAAIRRWRFPHLHAGGVVVVRYPFVLRLP